jgi:hypothetical protein
MGFNRRKMEDQRQQAAKKEAASRRASDAQLLEDAERLVGAWNERQAKADAHPVLADNRGGDQGSLMVPVSALPGVPNHQRYRSADRSSLRRGRDQPHSSALCRSCRSNAPFAELVRLSRTSIADEMRAEHTRQVLG